MKQKDKGRNFDSSQSILHPIISVIIVVLNGEKTLRRAIESVINQTYENTELLIVDGGSTDGTLEIIEAYRDQLNYFISKKDEGIYDAMNHALENCSGDWCLYLGCDDALLDCIHLAAPKMIDKQAVYYGNVIRNSIGDVYSGRFSKLKLTYKNICHQAIFYPKCCFYKKYDTQYRLLADYKHNIFLWGAGIPFNYIPYIIADYNNCGSASAGDKKFSKDKFEILGANFGFGFAFLWLIRELAASIYRGVKYG